jgi:hypothetical protein
MAVVPGSAGVHAQSQGDARGWRCRRCRCDRQRRHLARDDCAFEIFDTADVGVARRDHRRALGPPSQELRYVDLFAKVPEGALLGPRYPSFLGGVRCDSRDQPRRFEAQLAPFVSRLASWRLLLTEARLEPRRSRAYCAAVA